MRGAYLTGLRLRGRGDRGRTRAATDAAPDHGRAMAATYDSGYTLARMRYEILLAPEAVQDLRSLKASVRAAVREALEAHLRHEPEMVSKSRIKRLRGLSRPQYRLRVDEVRVFYDVTAATVEVLAIVAKSEAEAWLVQFGSPE
jgi:mRNA-degrading endonuclease RelE of RelBE toxin-antitoxin system